MLRRRVFLSGAILAIASYPTLRRATAQVLSGTEQLRGAIDATQAGVRSNSPDDQTSMLQAAIDNAAARNMPLFLPPGRYLITHLELPDGARLTGIAGASRLVHIGHSSLLGATDTARAEISNLIIDGNGQRIEGDDQALVTFVRTGAVLIDNCEIMGSGGTGLRLERCGGRIERSTISKAADMGLYAVECSALSITANTVHDCANGGILVHRWDAGKDGTLVQGNRVFNIRADSGGTGEFGNGINIFKADDVMVSNNHISDCAFTAIRANSASDIQIIGNQCLRSGETAIYAEFVFEGAMIASNLIDGAANGIVVANFMDGGRLATVTGNLIRNLSLTGPYQHDGAGFGFGISVEADTVVSDNVIENAPRYGMMLGWGPYLRDVVASGNIIRHASVGLYVTVVEEAGVALIDANLFSDVPEGAIVGYRWNERATGELINDASEHPHLTLVDNRKLRK